MAIPSGLVVRIPEGVSIRMVAAALLLAAVSAPSYAATVPRPDLQVSAITSPPRAAATGSSFAARATVVNAGTTFAGKSTLRYYLSRDRLRDLRDVQLHGASQIRALAPAGLQAASVKLWLPASVVPGNYYLLACADAYVAVRELRETNNCRASKGIVKVARAVAMTTQAYSDRRSVPDAAETAQLITMRRPRPLIKGDVGYGAALTGARTLLAAKESPAALAAFKTSAFAATAAQAERFAATALLDGKPGAALAGFLRAIDLSPNSADPLIGASQVLADHGDPRAALALARRALTKEFERTTAMGLNKQAVALNAEGYALLQLGRCAEAERSLRAAYEIEPLLSEARLNLGGALVCQGKAAGGRWLRAGSRRQQIMQDGSVEEKPTEGEPAVDVPVELMEKVVDLSQQQTFVRPNFAPEVPATWEELAAFVAGYPSYYYDKVLSWGQTAYDARQLRTSLEASQAYKDHLARQDADVNYFEYSFFLYDLDDPKRAEERFRAQFDLLRQEQTTLDAMRHSHSAKMAAAGQAVEADCTGIENPDAFKGCMQSSCLSNFGPLYAEGRQIALQTNTLRFERADLYYRHATSVIANFSTPVVHQVWSVFHETPIFDDMGSAYATLIGFAADWNSTWGMCFLNEPPPPEPGTPSAVSPGRGTACSPSVKRVSLSVDTPIGGFTANCDSMKLEVEGEGILAPFASWEASRSGEHTLVIGSKAGVAGAGISSGAYITTDSAGNVKDVGMRVKHEIEPQVGITKFQVGEDTMDISYVAGVRSLLAGEL